MYMCVVFSHMCESETTCSDHTFLKPRDNISLGAPLGELAEGQDQEQKYRAQQKKKEKKRGKASIRKDKKKREKRQNTKEAYE